MRTEIKPRIHQVVSRLIFGHPRVHDEYLSQVVRGNVVLITGASSGIGEATGRRLAACGAHVLLVAHTAERLELIAGQIRDIGGTATVYVTDLADMGQVDRLVQSVLDDHNHVDTLVINAGILIRRSIDESYDRFHDFEQLMDLNYFGAVKLTLGLLAAMRERGSGLIVNVSTYSVRMPPWPRYSAHQSSKTAFDVWLRSAAAEARADNVGVATIYMGIVDTPMTAAVPSLHHLPRLDVNDAAGLVCDLIARRRRNFSPWWALIVEVAIDAFPRLGGWAASIAYDYGEGSVATLGPPSSRATATQSGRNRNVSKDDSSCTKL